LRTVLDEERIYASMIARVTYDLAGEALTPAAEQPWDVSPLTWDTPLGSRTGDQVFRKEGVDLFVVGSVRAPKGVAARRVDLSFRVGDFESTAVAFGARVWRKLADGRLGPSEPEPFVTMPLSLALAFGGSYIVDEQVAAYALNPEGSGFYVDADAALDKPLPRLEDASSLVKAWDDKPDPIGFGLCQFPNPLRARESAIFVEEQASKGPPQLRFESFRSRMHNQAFPKMIAPTVKPGDRVILSGFSGDGPIAFVVPAPHLVVQIRLGEKLVERVPMIEEVGVDVDERQVFLGYRYPFRYTFEPEQIRTCTLAPRST
jgi:hypothetical protein